MNERYKLIVDVLKKEAPKDDLGMTANEVIESIWNSDMKKGIERDRKWLFYTHMNKIFKPLERSGNIKHIGDKVGPTNRLEKLWIAK